MKYSVLINAISFAIAYLGWATLALSQEKHLIAITEKRESTLSSIAKWSGICLLIFSLILTWIIEGPSFGSLLGIIKLSASAILVTLTLAWKPTLLNRWARCFS